MCKFLLRDFLINYNFKKAKDDNEGGFNTAIIRIYLSETNLNDWFEFGIYDFDRIGNKILRITKVFNKTLLDKVVTSYFYDEDENKFSIILASSSERSED